MNPRDLAGEPPCASPIDTATHRQRLASRPDASAWVMASAGSGKTQVLTDRIARLLLAGARPESLLCLTYTKAAAVNMQTRLNRKLSGWAAPSLSDAALAAELVPFLGGPPDATMLANARSLLATALDTPGGLRIGTIHSFAQALLRRFPLEAGIAPHFTPLDEFDRAELLRAAREDVFATLAREPAFELLAGHFAPFVFGRVIRAALECGTPPPDHATLLRMFDLPADATHESLAAMDVQEADDTQLRHAARALCRTAGEKQRCAEMQHWLDLPAEARLAGFQQWRGIFLKADGAARAPGGLITDQTEAMSPGTRAILVAEAERLVAAALRHHALDCAAITAALGAVVGPIAGQFRDAKTVRAALDFGDLIDHADRLLREQESGWVLFRLDGGLDHLLIDEAQDTAPAQWRMTRALTAEFFAGEGARADAGRTMFAVGDPKQSIFSFQGTAPEHFVDAGAEYRALAGEAGRAFEAIDLPVSFRSTQPVLDLVFAVQPTWKQHIAARQGQAGSAELWPLALPPPDVENEHGDRLPGADHALAQAIAGRIAAMIGSTHLEPRGRTARAGDFLVLVRRRGDFVEHLIRALKNQHPPVPVAGADRLHLAASLAVQDCVAFLHSLLLPEDDLTLAAVLKGPFCGLAEDSLMQLALDRGGRRLIAALRTRRDERPDWAFADTLLAKFQARADFDDPHALLCALLDGAVAEAPTGRQALIARLGEEAIEPIDELLRAALADTLRHPPSLQGFLHRLATANAEIKRDADTNPNAVRIMTVHGAKGLEAPIVILADTTGLPKPAADVIETAHGTVWLPNKACRPPLLQAACEAASLRAMAEHERLLYVALTRAEDALIVTGWQGRKGEPDPQCWYRRVEAGFDRLGAAADDNGIRRIGTDQTAKPDRVVRTDAAARPTALPGWAAPAPAEAPAPGRLKPSGEDDAADPPEPLPPPAPGSAEARRLARGDLTHTLLQFLPTLPAADRAAAAARLLARDPALAPADRQTIAAETLAVLADPDAALLFQPAGLAEAPIVGEVDGRPVNGVIDRLVVLPERVLLADFKTDRTPPSDAASVPEKYLRQLAIYRHLLRQMFDRPVEAALVWTAAPRVMWLPAPLLDRAFASLHTRKA